MIKFIKSIKKKNITYVIEIDDPTDKDVYKLFEDNFSKYTSIKGLDTSRYSIITIEEICGEYRYNHEYILKRLIKKLIVIN